MNPTGERRGSWEKDVEKLIYRVLPGKVRLNVFGPSDKRLFSKTFVVDDPQH
jgi:hypothetical protein